LVEMVPSVLLPPVTLFTCQVTVESLELLTVAVNCCVAPGGTVAVLGEIETERLPPPQPVASAARTITMARANCFTRSPVLQRRRTGARGDIDGYANPAEFAPMLERPHKNSADRDAEATSTCAGYW